MNMWKKNEDGDMGIGTMIIFIAMVLVAAVAAALVINVAYNLQQQGQDTGDQAIGDVSSGFQILKVVGDRANDTGVSQSTLQNVSLYVKLHSGSPAIDLEGVTITITDGTTVASLRYTTGAVATSTQFNASEVQDSLPNFVAASNPVVTQGDVIKLNIDAQAVSLSLSVGTSCSIKIAPESGQSSIEEFTCPTTYTTRFVDLA